MPGEIGDLVSVRDAVALAEVLGKLIAGSRRRLLYGQAGCELAARRFGNAAVVDTTMSIYLKLNRLVGTAIKEL